VELYIYEFFTTVLRYNSYMEMNGQFYFTVALPWAKSPLPHTHWIGGWVDLRGGLEAMEERTLKPRTYSPQLFISAIDSGRLKYNTFF
jgi:hypothetical protein